LHPHAVRSSVCYSKALLLADCACFPPQVEGSEFDQQGFQDLLSGFCEESEQEVLRLQQRQKDVRDMLKELATFFAEAYDDKQPTQYVPFCSVAA
jgi:hypothetical protein